MSIAFIGGTGPEGLGLAMRLAKAGEEVIIGSRQRQRAIEAAAKVAARVPQAQVRAMTNVESADASSIIFLTVPFIGHSDALEAIRPAANNKIVVDVVVPVDARSPNDIRALAVEDGSAAEQAQLLLPRARIVSGFHHIDARELMRLDKRMEADVLICGDDVEAKQVVIELAEKIEGVRALDAGPLANSRYLEAVTVVLLGLNRRYKGRSALKIVGI